MQQQSVAEKNIALAKRFALIIVLFFFFKRIHFHDKNEHDKDVG